MKTVLIFNRRVSAKRAKGIVEAIRKIGANVKAYQRGRERGVSSDKGGA